MSLYDHKFQVIREGSNSINASLKVLVKVLAKVGGTWLGAKPGPRHWVHASGCWSWDNSDRGTCISRRWAQGQFWSRHMHHYGRWPHVIVTEASTPIRCSGACAPNWVLGVAHWPTRRGMAPFSTMGVTWWLVGRGILLDH
ncbi:hypothetical protein TanjilG_25934 [Lupinus angustifolius]|uniref:Uncharacterized protein n=1 Tax=Lupinus angustifolius TaxID=3871 RepID=A0A394DC84_LUPAN|nr:hypothetical protein TanjilG_25934 [Lupinus angustifolius]